MYTSICSKASYLLDSEILRDVQASNRASSRLFKTVKSASSLSSLMCLK